MTATGKGYRDGTQIPESLSTKLNRLSEAARKEPGRQFQNIAHLIDVEMLRWSFHQLRPNAAAGVDGIATRDYEGNLERNLQELHARLRQGQYRAQPLRRIYIDKEDGKKRPLSIPALEDKLVQRAVSELLTRIYENDFLPCSYGYRPGRGAHDALDAIDRNIGAGKVRYILDADISDYFGNIVRRELMTMLQKRVVDKHLLALIGKWLHVGVIEEGKLLLAENGTYQGSVISPVLANLYLHEVLDLWFTAEVKPRMKGEAQLFRYADDLIATFEHKEDAERFMQVLGKRFGKFGLKLHPDKTQLIEFGWDAWRNSLRTKIKPATFNFLGFTHYTGTSRRGKCTTKVKTMAKRLKRGLLRIGEWCKEHRHLPVQKQQEYLKQSLTGHYAYYGRMHNYRAIRQFHQGVRRLWKKWLSRRSADGYQSWEKLEQILKKHPLPKPRIIHSGLRSRRSQLGLWCEAT